MKFDFNLEDKPTLGVFIINGLQWFVIIIPIIIIVSKIISITFSVDTEGELLYVQKLTLIVSISIFLQILLGHKLPIIPGPATVLLVGIVSSEAFNISSIYTALLLGSILLSLLGITNVIKYMLKLFTKNIITVVLILIAFAMLPTVINLIEKPIGLPVYCNFLIAFFIFILLFLLENKLKGFWQNSLILWTILVGTLIFSLIGGKHNNNMEPVFFNLAFFKGYLSSLWFDPALIFSFIICYLALAVNDVGSISSVATFVKAKEDKGRVKRGVFVTGFTNFISSMLGTIGVVNYSFSPGIIMITKCASKYVLLFTASLLFIISFSPYLISFVQLIHPFIIGIVFFYIMASQTGAGFYLLFEDKNFEYRDGVIVGFSVMLGTLMAFMPESITTTYPNFLMPFLSNGFVIGVVFAFILEHLIYKKTK
ncbi:MAG: solute carrier family 23 protein [Deferribacterota bacterium]|nr:solute carrier family 23 protein [Deferribacterota bacterium]